MGAVDSALWNDGIGFPLCKKSKTLIFLSLTEPLQESGTSFWHRTIFENLTLIQLLLNQIQWFQKKTNKLHFVY